LYAQLGQAVAQLQSIRFPSCGEIGPDGAVIDGAPYIEAFARRARRRIANPNHANLFVALLQQRAALFSDVPAGVLAHEDLNPTNLLLLDEGGAWRLSSILDFDSAWAGTAESDLARLELWRGMTGEGFHQAYEAIAPIAAGYRHRRALCQLLWCLEFASPTAQHHADTARVCAELGIARITFPYAG
jgi:fructosamine-3-kinase